MTGDPPTSKPEPHRPLLPIPGSGTTEAQFFATINAVIEPMARVGWLGAPGPWWVGPVVVETRGRRTGRIYNVPLLAARSGRLFVVSTVRGRRSQWVSNLCANPAVRVWSAGRPRAATAYVLAAGGDALPAGDPPDDVRNLATALGPGCALLGLRVAILVSEATG